MGDHYYNDAVRPPHKAGVYFVMPQHCQLEMRSLSDWHLYPYRQRFSSSSFADEELSRRQFGREVSDQSKFRQKDWSRSEGHGYGLGYPPWRTVSESSQPLNLSGPEFGRTRFSHSSSDDDVFMPLDQRPPPCLDSHFAPPPHPVPEYGNPWSNSHFQTKRYRYEQDRSEKMDSEFIEKPAMMKYRHHSVPPGRLKPYQGHGFLSDHNWPEGHGTSRDCGPPGYHRPIHKGHLNFDSHLPGSVKEGSADEGSLPKMMGGSGDMRDHSEHGLRGRLGQSEEERKAYSEQFVFSDNLAVADNWDATSRQRNMNNGGFLVGMGSANKWSVMNKVLPGPQSSEGHIAHPKERPVQVLPSGQNVMIDQPLRPGQQRSLHHANKSAPSITNKVKEIKPLFPPLPIEEKLRRFVLFIRNKRSPRINDILTIENAITGCHLDLKTEYKTEDVGVYQGRHTYSGKLALSGVFLARAVGQVKKELKHECYTLALQVLKKKDVHEILKQHDIGIEAIRQKFEECSAANVGDAVINLASAAPIAVAMETMATTAERWQDFVSHLKGLTPEMGNTISRIEMALSGSRCGLERQYVDLPVMDRIQSKPGFQGSLTIGGILQAEGQGTKKKEAKLMTYDAAYDRFTKLELSEIVKGIEPQTFEEFKRAGKAVNHIIKEIRSPEHIKKFELFIDRIKDSTVREGPITLMDLMANQFQLLITCMYTKTEDVELSILCQLFVGDILISEGEGHHRKEAQADAYNKAYEVLISTPLETITSENHRLNREELEGPDVQEIVVKGQSKKEESNISRLRSQYPNIETMLSQNKVEELVIVEHEDWIHDRRRHAFCILQNSALGSAMLLKWCIEIETRFFICRIFLQEEEIAVARSHSRQHARNLAAADALFQMYETHPVLRIMNTDPSSYWITRSQLIEKMKSTAESEFEEADTGWNDYLKKKLASMQESEDGGDGTQFSEEQKENGKIERRLRVVALNMVKEFQHQGNVLDELIFAPDLPVSVRRYLPIAVARIGLRSIQSQKDGKIFVCIHHRLRMDEIVAAMKEQGISKTNRFLLVEDRSELPCHADIAQELKAAQIWTSPDRGVARTAFRATKKESRDAAVGNSLNGSLYEDTEEGFVTAQSSVISEANATLHPQGQSTPQATPAKINTSSRSQTTPIEEVYAKFAKAMIASGIGQTLIPMESSTPVANILLNPPTSDSISSKSHAQLVKNILVDPPESRSTNVTLSKPMRCLSVSSSAAAFPQPDFTCMVSPSKSFRSQPSFSNSSSSTLSADSTTVSLKQSDNSASPDPAGLGQHAKLSSVSEHEPSNSKQQLFSLPVSGSVVSETVTQSLSCTYSQNSDMAISQTCSTDNSSQQNICPSHVSSSDQKAWTGQGTLHGKNKQDSSHQIAYPRHGESPYRHSSSPHEKTSAKCGNTPHQNNCSKYGSTAGKDTSSLKNACAGSGKSPHKNPYPSHGNSSHKNIYSKQGISSHSNAYPKNERSSNKNAYSRRGNSPYKNSYPRHSQYRLRGPTWSGSSSDDIDSQCRNSFGGSWQQPSWQTFDPSAPHTIQMSPGSNNEGDGEKRNVLVTAMYIENELSATNGKHRSHH